MNEPSGPATAKEDADLDRLVARSLAASERGGREADAAARRRPSLWPWLVAMVGLALIGGLAARPLLDRSLPGLSGSAAPPAEATAASADPELVQRLAMLEARLAEAAAQAPAAADAAGAAAGAAVGAASAEPPAATLEARIAALESADGALRAADERLTQRLDLMVRDVSMLSGGASRSLDLARDLLLVSALDRLFGAGRSFAALEPAIEARIAPRDRPAAEALMAWSRAPVSAATLAATMPGTDDPQEAAADGDFWSRLRERFGRLVEVRVSVRGLEESGRQEIRRALDSGDLAAAIARMEAVPAGAARDRWLADARRLLDAQVALERVEATVMATVATELAAPAAPAAGSPPGGQG